MSPKYSKERLGGVKTTRNILTFWNDDGCFNNRFFNGFDVHALISNIGELGGVADYNFSVVVDNWPVGFD